MEADNFSKADADPSVQQPSRVSNEGLITAPNNPTEAAVDLEKPAATMQPF